MSVSETAIYGLYLMAMATKGGHDGVLLSNQCLQRLLGVKHVFKARAEALAGELQHLFPYSLAPKQENNIRVLYLGFLRRHPDHPLRVEPDKIPTRDNMLRQLHLD